MMLWPHCLFKQAHLSRRKEEGSQIDKSNTYTRRVTKLGPHKKQSPKVSSTKMDILYQI